MEAESTPVENGVPGNDQGTQTAGMKRIIVLFAFVIVVVSVLLIASVVVKHKTAANQTSQITIGSYKGKAAPNFTLETLDGKKLTLSDLRGKAVVVNFWATWCPPCKIETPWLVDVQQKYGSQGLQVVGVAMDDASNDEISKFAKDMGMNYPVLLGKEEIAQSYGGIEYLPVTFFVDRDGKIYDRTLGIVSRPEMEQTVQKLLSQPAGS